MTQKTGRLALLALALTAACGSAPTTTTSSLATAPSARPTPPAVAVPAKHVAKPETPKPNPIPSFRTPEAAMRYLASAWNRGDLVAFFAASPLRDEGLEIPRLADYPREVEL